MSPSAAAACIYIYVRQLLHFECRRPELNVECGVVCCVQYFLPAAKKGINKQIELAILRADRMGVKVLSLAALNKVSSVLVYYMLHTQPANPCLIIQYVVLPPSQIVSHSKNLGESNFSKFDQIYMIK